MCNKDTKGYKFGRVFGSNFKPLISYCTLNLNKKLYINDFFVIGYLLFEKEDFN